MAADISLYTIAQMEASIVSSITSEASGYPKENLLDNNLDTYWKPTSTANQLINLDLASILGVYALLIFLKNYDAITAGCGVYIYGSNNLADWYQIDINGDGSQTVIGGKTLGPLRIIDYPSPPISYRYWRILLNAQNVVAQIAGIWYCTKYSLGQGNQWPENDLDRFYNLFLPNQSGRDHFISINKKRNLLSPRSYIFDGTTAFDKLRTAFNNSRGRLWPLIIQEGDSYDDARVVRFSSDEFGHAEYQSDLYRSEITFTDIPYIEPGDTY